MIEEVLVQKMIEDEINPNYNIEYDPKNKIINIPLILDNSKVTGKKIRYQFKGKYFEKM